MTTETTVFYETPPCPLCGEQSAVELDAEGFRRWQQGAKVQHVWPGESADWRERLITGTHPECWKKIFAAEERENRNANR